MGSGGGERGRGHGTRDERRQARERSRAEPAWQVHALSAEHAGQRVDRRVAELTGLGRAGARRLLDAGRVRLNGRRATKGAVLKAGDRLELASGAGTSQVEPNPGLPLPVVYEGPGVVVVDKPAGMHCHPLDADDSSTLVSAVLARYPELRGVGYGPLEPGLLHRLDFDTSGLVLFGRNQDTFEHFAASLRPSRPGAASTRVGFMPGEASSSKREGFGRGAEDGAGDAGAVLRKRYLALCAGEVAAPAEHRAWLRARGPRVTVCEAAGPGLRAIETSVLSAQPAGPHTLVELSVPSAARHQLRAHLAALGHPIVGDALYGGPPLAGLERHFLHASQLELRLPGAHDWLVLKSALPAELEAALATARALSR